MISLFSGAGGNGMFGELGSPPSLSRGRQAALAKLDCLLNMTASRRPSEVQYTLATDLYDDACEYMTTLSMNRAASYTFACSENSGVGSPDVVGALWEILLDLTLCRPMWHSILALQKTVILTKHVLLHGSEAGRNRNNGELLSRIRCAVDPLRNYNTALMEQMEAERILAEASNAGAGSGGGSENKGAVNTPSFSARAQATLVKLRGGSVDRGHPVRVAAQELFDMLSDVTTLNMLRMQNVNSSSLVPVGSSHTVGFATDAARLKILQSKIQREKAELSQKKTEEEAKKTREKAAISTTRSNLARQAATNGFGGGFSSSGGKVVVGAAHSLDEMIANAKLDLESTKTKRMAQLHQQSQLQYQTVEAFAKGYVDDPAAKARQVEGWKQKVDAQQQQKVFEHQRMAPKEAAEEQALREALEYLEEMRAERGNQQQQDHDVMGFDGLRTTMNSGSTNNFHAGAHHDFFGGGMSEADQYQQNGQEQQQVDLLDLGGVHTATPTLMPVNDMPSHYDAFATATTSMSDASMTRIGTSLVTGCRGLGGDVFAGVDDRAGANANSGGAQNYFLGVTHATSGERENAERSGNSIGLSCPSPASEPSSEPPMAVITPGYLPVNEEIYCGKEMEDDTERARKMKMATQLFAGMAPMPGVPSAALMPIMGEQQNTDLLPAMNGLIPISSSGSTANAMSLISAMSVQSSKREEKIDLGDLISMDAPDVSKTAASTVASTHIISDVFPSSFNGGLPPMGGSSGTGLPPPPPDAPPPPPPIARSSSIGLPPPPPDAPPLSPPMDPVPTSQSLAIPGPLSSDASRSSMPSSYDPFSSIAPPPSASMIGMGNLINPMTGATGVTIPGINNQMAESVDNLSANQMREMMIQQQAQMQQMMNMMISMGIQQQPQQIMQHPGISGGGGGAMIMQHQQKEAHKLSPFSQDSDTLQNQNPPSDGNSDGSAWAPNTI